MKFVEISLDSVEVGQNLWLFKPTLSEGLVRWQRTSEADNGFGQCEVVEMRHDGTHDLTPPFKFSLAGKSNVWIDADREDIVP